MEPVCFVLYSSIPASRLPSFPAFVFLILRKDGIPIIDCCDKQWDAREIMQFFEDIVIKERHFGYIF
jgi:hypothetical protein